MGELTLALQAGETPLAPALSEPWVTPADLSSCGVPETVDLSSVCTVASEILYRLSGRQFGVRTETVRPRAGQRTCGWTMVGQWVSVTTDWLFWYKRNEGAPDWVLLKSPVRQVLEVKVDGEVLDSSLYVVYDNRKLVRRPDPVRGLMLTWPIYQRIDLPDTELGTFSVNYQWGNDVPAAGKIAAQVFATQLAKYVNRDADCALPDRVVSVTRQGVTQTLMDPSQFTKEARTGLYLVDMWLAAVNPNGNRRRPTVTSPDSIELLRPT